MEIKERIKKKADELFRRYGIKSVTMDEISVQLGISKKTIYQSFSDKNELVDEVMTDMLNYNQECCQNYRIRSKNAIHEIFLAMEMMRVMFENLNPTILFDLERHHVEAFNRFKEFKYGFLRDMLRDNLKRGIDEGLYRSEIDIDIIATVRLETMMMAFNEDLFPKNRFSLAGVQQKLIEYYLFGIASLKGYRLIMKYLYEQTGNLPNTKTGIK
jgi:TetR/AcrR family transcriptional regulator, cholesterol catabolism regulator